MANQQKTSSIRRRLIALAVAAPIAGLLPLSTLAQAQEKIIVSGASGQLGGLTVKALLARGVPASNLILVSRTPETLQEYAKLGASVRFGDFSAPESLPAAYAGGTRMLLISIGFGAGPRPEAHKRAIDAAKAAGVRHIVYTSHAGISRGEREGRIAADHLATEEILKDSGVSWTILRNSFYMESVLEPATKMVAAGRAAIPADETRKGYVARGDCAAAAAAVLATPGHEGKIYDITGAELIGVREVAVAASAVTGRKIDIVAAGPDTPPVELSGPPFLGFTSTAVADLTGRPAVSLQAFLAANEDALLGATR